MTEELKPCPFCGGKAKIKKDDEGNHFYVLCKKCGTKSISTANETEAIDLWNMRPDKLINCPCCNHSYINTIKTRNGYIVWCPHCGISTGYYEEQNLAFEAWNRRNNE